MGRNAEGLKAALEHSSGKTIPGSPVTTGEVMSNFNALYRSDIKVVIKPVDSVTGAALTGTTVALKTGSSVGSGTAVSAETDGSYKCSVQDYNYSISKTGYTTKTGTFSVDGDDALAANGVEITVQVVASAG